MLLQITLLSMVIAIGLSACHDRRRLTETKPKSNRTSTRASDDVAALPIIDNEDLLAGLIGTDSDQNGIRDDIDRLITKKYSSPAALKRAAQQKARALQGLMMATTRQQAILAGDEIVRATHCAAQVVPLSDPKKGKLFLKMSKELSALTANTEERFTAYWDANELAAGAVFSQSKTPVCD